MKKTISFALVLSIILLFTGCNKANNSSSNPVTNPTINQTVAPITLDTPFLSVGLPAETTSITADDGTLICSTSTPYMTLTMDGQVTADLIIHDFMDKINTARVSAESIEESAKAAYAQQNTSTWNAYHFTIDCTPTRMDPNALSIYGIVNGYSGGSHPVYSCISTNYNLITGDPLTLGSILIHEESIAKLRDLLIEELDKQKEEMQLRSGYENDINSRFEKDVSYDDAWYFTEYGLCFYFPPYEIAPYSSGIITAEIPYSSLVGIIDDAFFPPEYIANGNAKVIPYSDDLANSYQETSELILDREGKKYFIEADSCIQNIRIVLQSSDDAHQIIRTICYRAYCLNPGDAVMVQLPEKATGSYFVEYEQNGTTVTLPFSQ